MKAERFPSDWLTLREAVDHRSRSAALLPPLHSHWVRFGWSRVLDLGCGTGSNLRYLAPRLPGRQDWTLLDHDRELIDRVTVPAPDGRDAGRVIRVERVVGDLGSEGLRHVPGTDLVTASALLDLVTETWLRELVTACASAGSGALLALSYDGIVDWLDGGDPDDDLIRGLVNRHQERDKGMGPALGPTGGGRAEALFRAEGFTTYSRPSPWRLGPADEALARELVRGWAGAALEESPWDADRIGAWLERRHRAMAGGKCELAVGHLDLLALPPAPPVREGPGGGLRESADPGRRGRPDPGGTSGWRGGGPPKGSGRGSR